MNDTTGIDIIDVAELENLVTRGAPVVIAEILPPNYYEFGHLPRARCWPLAGFEETVRAAAIDKGTRVIVYCASSTCSNSDIAAQKLALLGYSNVSVFRGGKAAWVDAGLALEKVAVAS